MPRLSRMMAMKMSRLIGSWNMLAKRLFSLPPILVSLSSLFLRNIFIARMYSEMSTKNLLPTSANAAIARLFSPKNSAMNGKQDKPGANEGISIIRVRPVGLFFSIPNNANASGAEKNIRKLKTSVTTGMMIMEESISIFIKEIKIVDGNATDKMISLIPFVWSLFLNLDFKRSPNPINNKSVMVFCNASLMIKNNLNGQWHFGYAQCDSTSAARRPCYAQRDKLC